MKACNACQTPWQGEGSPKFKEACESCSAYLHSCKNCRLHDPGAHNQCLSPTTEWVADREGLNYCEEFDFKAGPGDRGSEEKTAEGDWDRLFKKDPES